MVPFVILLWPTPNNFTREQWGSGLERLLTLSSTVVAVPFYSSRNLALFKQTVAFTFRQKVHCY